MSLFNLLAPHSEGAVPIDKGFNLLSLFRSIIPNSYNIVKSFLALFALFSYISLGAAADDPQMMR